MYIFRFVDFFPLSIVKMTIIPRTLLFEFEKKLIHGQLVFSLKVKFFSHDEHGGFLFIKMLDLDGYGKIM